MVELFIYSGTHELLILKKNLSTTRLLWKWVCHSGTHGLVYRIWPIMKVDKYKDSNINLETKKGKFNTFSTRTLVNSSLVAYIKLGRGAPRETTYNIDIP
jgi:hypothetical protein